MYKGGFLIFLLIYILLFSPSIFVIPSSGSLMYTSKSSANENAFNSSFPNCILLISYSCLIALSKTSNTVLKWQGIMNYLVLFLILLELLCILAPIGIDIGYELFEATPSVIVWYVHCIPNFSRNFIMRECWILSKTCSESKEMIVWLLFLNLFM